MTRCYEFYCAVKKDAEFCQDKGDRIVDYINEYIAFMETKSVKFNRSTGDKGLFTRLVGKYGSEYRVTQAQELAEEISKEINAPEKTRQIQEAILKTNIESHPVCPTCEPHSLKEEFCPICPKSCDNTAMNCPVVTFIKWRDSQ